MPRHLLTALALGALAALWLAMPLPDAVASPSATALLGATTHTVEIRYQGRSGRLRSADIRVSVRDGARPMWRGEIAEIAVMVASEDELLGARGSSDWIIAREVESARNVTRASARLPDPEHIVAFAVRTSQGLTFIYPRSDSAYGDKDDEEPPPETPPAEDPPEEPAGDRETCRGAGSCVGIFNPWTCECESDIRDPWENVRQDGASVTFAI